MQRVTLSRLSETRKQNRIKVGIAYGERAAFMAEHKRHGKAAELYCKAQHYYPEGDLRLDKLAQEEMGQRELAAQKGRKALF